MFDKDEVGQLRHVIKEVVDESIGQALEDVVLPRFEQVDQEIGWMKANMVTRDFLEDRLADFRTSLTDSADWVGRQLKRLTNTMHQDGLLAADQVIQIHAK